MSLVCASTSSRRTAPRIEEMDLSGEQLALMKSVLELLPMISDDEAAMLRGQMEGLAALRRKG